MEPQNEKAPAYPTSSECTRTERALCVVIAAEAKYLSCNTQSFCKLVVNRLNAAIRDCFRALLMDDWAEIMWASCWLTLASWTNDNFLKSKAGSKPFLSWFHVAERKHPPTLDTALLIYQIIVINLSQTFFVKPHQASPVLATLRPGPSAAVAIWAWHEDTWHLMPGMIPGAWLGACLILIIGLVIRFVQIVF